MGAACTTVEEHMVIGTVFTMLHGVTQHPYSSLISNRKMRKMGYSKVKRLLEVTYPRRWKVWEITLQDLSAQ